MSIERVNYDRAGKLILIWLIVLLVLILRDAVLQDIDNRGRNSGILTIKKYGYVYVREDKLGVYLNNKRVNNETDK